MLRALSGAGVADWRALHQSRLFADAVAAGDLVATEEVEENLLRHEAVPFVSYPYEWSFGMLKEAALLQLRLTAAALDEGLILKDASPYNVQWRGAKPVFVDVGSFEGLRAGEPWEGYRQFCMLFLYPLMLQAYGGVPFNARLRGSVDGIPPAEMRGVLRGRAAFRRGVLTHVRLHAKLERRYGDRRRNVRRELEEAGFGAELIRANLRKLERLVQRLEWRAPGTPWLDYGATTSYSDRDAGHKEAFVARVSALRARGLVWDLGCNDGRFSRLVAPHAASVVALEGDTGVVDALFRSLADEGPPNVLPLVVDLADPSPSLGWRARERRPLWERGRPDLVLALALVHHLAIARNVPLAELLDWLRSLEAELVVEWVDPRDPMAARLLAAKREGLHDDYTRDVFERLLGERFDVKAHEELADGSRVLFHARPRA